MAPYNLENDPYIDQTTGVFRNKLGIKNVDELKEVEADIAATRIALITQQVTYEDTVLSKESLLNLHRVLFGELYDWAGQIRTVEIAKGETRFAHTDFISSELDRIFDELAAENYLKSYGEAQFFCSPCLLLLGAKHCSSVSRGQWPDNSYIFEPLGIAE